MAGDGYQKYVGAVENAVKILRYLANSGEPQGVAVIARITGINTSTAFNILRTLTKEKLISFDQTAKTYEISMGLLEFSLPLLGRSQADLIRPAILELVERYQVVMLLWSFTSNDRVVVQEKVTPRRAVRIEVDTYYRLPAFAGAIGRCYAAQSGLSNKDLMEVYKKITWGKAPDFKTYLKDVNDARKNGYSVDFGNLFVGVNIAAALINNGQKRPVLGLSALALAGHYSKSEMRDIGEEIDKQCRTIAKLLMPAKD